MASSILQLIIETIKKGTGLEQASKGLDDFEKGLNGVNKVLGVFGLAIGAKEIFDFGAASVAAARESIAAEAELAAALRASGQATAGYKDQLQGLAAELQNTSNFTDEAVLHAQSILLTFDKIGQDTMPRATRAVADLAQLMGGDLQSASLQIGKAMQGQLSALQRSGISFTESEKALAEALFASGKAAEAQAVILGALERQVGGQAAAAREAAGGWQDSAVAMGNFQEEFGKLIMALGNTGAGDASVTLLNQLTEGARAWTTVISESLPAISEFMAAQENLNPVIAGSVMHQEAQRAAIEATTRAEGEAAQAKQALAAGALQAARAATDTADSHEELGEEVDEGRLKLRELKETMPEVGVALSENRMRAAELAGTYKDLGKVADQTAAQIEGLARAQEQANQGQLDLRSAKEAAPELGARITEQRQKVFEIQKEQEEEAAAESERNFKASTAAMVKATNELGNQISSAVSGAVSQSSADIAKLLGIDAEGEARVNEGVRRMAAVATGGLANEWTQGLAQQLKGVDAAQAFVNAVAGGNESAVKEEARKLALAPIVELFDVNAMANGIEQKLRGQDLNGQLNQRIQKILSEKGLDTSIEAISQVAQGTQAVADTATTSVGTIGASATGAGEQVKAAFTDALPAIDTLSARISLLIGLIERVGVVAATSAGAVAGLNPPEIGAGAGLVPNGAQKKMNGMSPQ